MIIAHYCKILCLMYTNNRHFQHSFIKPIIHYYVRKVHLRFFRIRFYFLPCRIICNIGKRKRAPIKALYFLMLSSLYFISSSTYAGALLLPYSQSCTVLYGILKKSLNCFKLIPLYSLNSLNVILFPHSVFTIFVGGIAPPFFILLCTNSRIMTCDRYPKYHNRCRLPMLQYDVPLLICKCLWCCLC